LAVPSLARRDGGGTCLVAEGTGTGTTTLAQHDRDILIKIDIARAEAGHLGRAHARVQEEPDDGGVPPISKPLLFIEPSSRTSVGSSRIATGSSGIDGGFIPVMGATVISSSSPAQR
jgi:hypothetical protein